MVRCAKHRQHKSLTCCGPRAPATWAGSFRAMARSIGRNMAGARGLEALIAEIVAGFVRNHDRERERCWIAERAGENVGSVLLVLETDEVARLRLLLVEPRAR